MSRLRISDAMRLATILLMVSGPLSAQDRDDDPTAVAIDWALEADGLSGLGTRLMVDTQRGASLIDVKNARPISGSERQVRRDFAFSRGARIGTLEAHLRCPPESARRRVSVHGGCRLTDGIEAVVQIDPPTATDDGFEGVITTWIFAPHPYEDVWVLNSTHRELRLQKGAGGEWTVTPLSRANVHW